VPRETHALPMRIVGARLAPGTTDVWLYDVEFTLDGMPRGGANVPASQDGRVWDNLCGPGVPAVAFRGAWNYEEGTATGGAKISDDATIVTFGCTNAVLGKCGSACNASADVCAASNLPWSLGYKPWAQARRVSGFDGATLTFEYNDLQDEFQTCTRMVRADYCGDGTTHTVDGTRIDVGDDDWVNGPVTPGGDWYDEAGWDTNGAVRVACERLNPLGMPTISCPVHTAGVTTSPFGFPVFIPAVSSMAQCLYDPSRSAVLTNDVYKAPLPTVPVTVPTVPRIPLPRPRF
jgi:hypothetical protein